MTFWQVIEFLDGHSEGLVVGSRVWVKKPQTLFGAGRPALAGPPRRLRRSLFFLREPLLRDPTRRNRRSRSRRYDGYRKPLTGWSPNVSRSTWNAVCSEAGFAGTLTDSTGPACTHRYPEHTQLNEQMRLFKGF